MNLNRVIFNVYDNRRVVKTLMQSFLSVSSRLDDIILKVVVTQDLNSFLLMWS